ncbi:MAG: UbiA family prenyltransferase [Candidatus Magasanikbacteria bacterium]
MIAKLISTSRPMTGVFAALLSVAGFRYFNDAPWMLVSATAVLFLGITWHIMSFNDLMDRVNDLRKNKRFAYENEWALRQYIAVLSSATLTVLGAVTVWDMRVGFFCACVWALGVLYSFVPHWFVVQNLIVAVCSGSPVLVGVVNSGEVDYRPLLVFCAFVFIIFIREVYKDIEDQDTDTGYKTTLPIVLGHEASVEVTTGLTFGWAVCLFLYPDTLLGVIGLGGGSALLSIHQELLYDHRKFAQAKAALDWVIRAVIVSILITQ